MKESSLLNIKIHKSKVNENLDLINILLNENEKNVISFINPELIYEAYFNKKLAIYFNKICKYNFIDGIGILIIKWIFGENLYPRNTGTDFMDSISKFALKNKQTIFLLGGKEKVILKARENLLKKYPKLLISGHHHGYFSNSETKNLISYINSKSPDILIVCLGFPKQEFFIMDNLSNLNARLLFANGGALDFISNNVKRAPLIIRKIGFEWLWRLFQDFSFTRIQRQIKYVPFVFLSIISEIKQKLF